LRLLKHGSVSNAGSSSCRCRPAWHCGHARPPPRLSRIGTDTVATAHTGDDDRSLAIAADGRSLYVVNYQSDTVTKLRASDLQTLQNISTGVHPIGITYDATTGNVWVAVYSGQILVLGDRRPG
jgi:YVTN family beta-propeller protein